MIGSSSTEDSKSAKFEKRTINYDTDTLTIPSNPHTIRPATASSNMGDQSAVTVNSAASINRSMLSSFSSSFYRARNLIRAYIGRSEHAETFMLDNEYI